MRAALPAAASLVIGIGVDDDSEGGSSQGLVTSLKVLDRRGRRIKTDLEDDFGLALDDLGPRQLIDVLDDDVAIGDWALDLTIAWEAVALSELADVDTAGLAALLRLRPALAAAMRDELRSRTPSEVR